MPRVFLKMPNSQEATSFVQMSPLTTNGATVYPDFEFSIFPPEDAVGATSQYWEPLVTQAPMVFGKNLQDVLTHIHAPEAWTTSRGAGVTIAMVDSGVCSTPKEFAAAKRSPGDIPSAYSGNHRTDTKRHGSMWAVSYLEQLRFVYVPWEIS